jgi:hypothetical protein
VSRTIYPYEEYVLAGSPAPAEIPEDDLFAGVQDRVSQ